MGELRREVAELRQSNRRADADAALERLLDDGALRSGRRCVFGVESRAHRKRIRRAPAWARRGACRAPARWHPAARALPCPARGASRRWIPPRTRRRRPNRGAVRRAPTAGSRRACRPRPDSGQSPNFSRAHATPPRRRGAQRCRRTCARRFDRLAQVGDLRDGYRARVGRGDARGGGDARGLPAGPRSIPTRRPNWPMQRIKRTECNSAVNGAGIG